MSNNQRVMDSLDDWLLMRWLKDQWVVVFATIEICSIQWMFACQFWMIVCNYWMVVCKYWMFDQEYILWFSGVAVFFARMLQALESCSYCQASRMPRNRIMWYLPGSWDGPFFCSNTFWPDLCPFWLFMITWLKNVHLCPDGRASTFFSRYIRSKMRFEFSLENAQSGKMSTVVQLGSFGEKTARAACFPRTRIDLRFSDCARMVNHEHPW